MAVDINDPGSMRNAILNRKTEIYNFVDFINGSFDRIRRDLLHKSVLQDIGSIARDTYAHIIEAVGKRGSEVRLTGSQGKYPITLFSPASQLPPVPKTVNRSGLYRSGLSTTGNFADPRFIETPYKGAARTDTNVFYRESALPNELFNFPLATMEQAEQMRAEDARTKAQRDKWAKVNELIRENAHKRVIEGIEQNREKAEYYENWAYQGRRYKRQERAAAFKEFRWLKPIARNIPLIGKNLPAIAKTLHEASKTPVIGKILRHPGLATIGGAIAGMRLIGSMTEAADKGNAYVVSAQNAMNLYGKPSKEFENAAYLAGYKDPAQIAKLYGQLTMQFGSAEAALPMLGKALAKAPPLARMAVAQQFGLDANSMALIDILSGNGRINAGGEVRQTNALKNIASANILMGLSSESGVQTRAQIANFAQTLGFNPAGMDARHFREANLELYDRLTRQMIDNGMGANQAALSAADYISNGGASATQSVRGGDTFILNGDVSLPNATDAEGFTEGIKDKARSSSSSWKAVTTALDPTIR